MVDTSGQIISQSRYLPFGELLWEDGTSPTDYTYTGQRSLSDIGLMDYNARFYDPMLGRFTSPDSIVPDPGSTIDYNRYAYVYNNPIIYNDPTGHYVPPSVCAIAGGSIPECQRQGGTSGGPRFADPTIVKTRAQYGLEDPISGHPYIEDNPYLLQEIDNNIETVDINGTGWSYYSEYSNMWTYDFGDDSLSVSLDMERNSHSNLYIGINSIPTVAVLFTAAFQPEAPIIIFFLIEAHINKGRETLEASTTIFDDPCQFTGSAMANMSYPPDGDSNVPHPITVVVIDNAFHTDGTRISNTLVIVQNQDTGEARIINMSPAYLPEVLRELDKRNK